MVSGDNGSLLLILIRRERRPVMEYAELLRLYCIVISVRYEYEIGAARETIGRALDFLGGSARIRAHVQIRFTSAMKTINLALC